MIMCAVNQPQWHHTTSANLQERNSCPLCLLSHTLRLECACSTLLYIENNWALLYHNFWEAHCNYRLKYASLRYGLFVVSVANNFNTLWGTQHLVVGLLPLSWIPTFHCNITRCFALAEFPSVRVLLVRFLDLFSSRTMDVQSSAE